MEREMGEREMTGYAMVGREGNYMHKYERECQARGWAIDSMSFPRRWCFDLESPTSISLSLSLRPGGLRKIRFLSNHRRWRIFSIENPIWMSFSFNLRRWGIARGGARGISGGRPGENFSPGRDARVFRSALSSAFLFFFSWSFSFSAVDLRGSLVRLPIFRSESCLIRFFYSSYLMKYPMSMKPSWFRLFDLLVGEISRKRRFWIEFANCLNCFLNSYF